MDFRHGIVGYAVQLVLQRFLVFIGQSDRQDSFQKFKQVEHGFGKHTGFLDKVTQLVVSPADFRFEVSGLVCQRIITLFKMLVARMVSMQSVASVSVIGLGEISEPSGDTFSCPFSGKKYCLMTSILR